MNIKTKYNTVTSKQTIDKETGEILQEDVEINSHKYIAKTKEEFFLTYVYLLDALRNELSMPEVKIYADLLKNYKSDVKFALNKALKQDMADNLNLKLGTVNNSITNLVKKNLIFRITEGVFMLNPKYAFRGSSNDRKKQIIMTLEYNPEYGEDVINLYEQIYKSTSFPISEEDLISFLCLNFNKSKSYIKKNVINNFISLFNLQKVKINNQYQIQK